MAFFQIFFVDLDDLSKNYVVRKRKRNKDDDDQVTLATTVIIL